MATAPAKVVAVSLKGGIGNRMIQFMAAWRLASFVPGCIVAGVQLAEWGIDLPQVPPGPGAVLRLSESSAAGGQRIDLAAIVAAMNAGRIARVEMDHFAQDLRNFPPREVAAAMFRSPVAPIERFGRDTLLINIRAGEILAAPHPDYTLVPVAFYRQLVAETGLRPAFLGQLDPGPWLRSLHAAFPSARFIPSHGAMADFATLRAARNLVVAVSTFSWLAAWLSEAEQIHLPLTGFLNPAQSPQTHLLPLDDPRYRFTLFPANYAVPEAAVADAHAALAGLWRRMPPAMLAELAARRPRFPVPVQRMRDLFDEGFYLARYPDVRAVVGTGGYATGLQHYLMEGHAEGREGFALDRAWYCRAHPLAAIELGQGDFANLHEHYVAVGRERGYAPLPPDGIIRPYTST